MGGVWFVAVVPDLVHGEGRQFQRWGELAQGEVGGQVAGDALGQGQEQIGAGEDRRGDDEVGELEDDAPRQAELEKGAVHEAQALTLGADEQVRELEVAFEGQAAADEGVVVSDEADEAVAEELALA